MHPTFNKYFLLLLGILLFLVHLFVLKELEKTTMYCNRHQLSPCLHCHPHSYIRMVQHLIERCLLLRMSRDQCIKELEDHARIRPFVTLTVWRELLKENRGFFHAYYHGRLSYRPLMRRNIDNHIARLTRRQQWR